MSILSRRILLFSSAALTAAALLGPASAEDPKIALGGAGMNGSEGEGR